MQKVAAAGMGNPKERKECPICGKTLYDRSTWNRHMRIHTGKLHRFNGFVKKIRQCSGSRLNQVHMRFKIHLIREPLLKGKAKYS
jgi:Zinc-finger of C2H2 type